MTKFYQSPIIMISLILFLALVIGTIYRINTVFVTHPGLVVEDPYKSGQDYGKSKLNTENLKKQGYLLLMVKNTLNSAKNRFKKLSF